jgi:hypothetical protein
VGARESTALQALGLVPLAFVENSGQSWQIQASDQISRAADYRPLIVRYQGGAPRTELAERFARQLAGRVARQRVDQA